MLNFEIFDQTDVCVSACLKGDRRTALSFPRVLRVVPSLPLGKSPRLYREVKNELKQNR